MASPRPGRSDSKSIPNLGPGSAPPKLSMTHNPFKSWLSLVCGDASVTQNTSTSNTDDDGYGSLVEERLESEINWMDEEIVGTQDMTLPEYPMSRWSEWMSALFASYFRLLEDVCVPAGKILPDQQL